jgi:uncharacterized membrane protein
MPHRPARKIPPFLTAHGRLLLALLAGILVYVLLSVAPPESSTAPLRVALGWDVTAVAYLALSIRMMWLGDLESIRARAKAIDIGIVEIVTIAALAGLFSVFTVASVLVEARDLHGSDRVLHIGVGVVTVLLSWLALHVIYAVHYAHLYYDPPEKGAKTKARGGLDFPNTAEPDYWDFVYFSLVIGMTCQVSDVQVTARHIRHLVTAQGIIAFFYNTVVLALAVNIAAGVGS